MTLKRLIAVVGPSGVGKDSIMEGLITLNPSWHRLRRVITRAPELGGEDYEAVSEAEFIRRKQAGEFFLSWGAHGLFYGLPKSEMDHAQVIANFSRSALAEADASVPLTVLNITASSAVLAERLAGRGRETAQEIERRLAQADRSVPAGLNVIEICNDGSLDQAIQAAHQALSSERV